MIIAFSGRKQSGKSTAGNFIYSLYMAQLGISEKVYLGESGNILISDLFGDKNYSGSFSANNINPPDVTLQKTYGVLDKIIKIYNFADILKKNICMDILGLSYEQCYGTDEQKNDITNLRINNELASSREMMQYIGTDIFRKIKPDVWVDATIRQIMKENPKVAIITDCRFPNEVECIKNSGGKVIRLDRNPFNSDHLSETILDQNNYDWNNFDYVISNQEYSLYDQVSKLKTILEEILQL
jgi:hypothetical protein